MDTILQKFHLQVPIFNHCYFLDHASSNPLSPLYNKVMWIKIKYYDAINPLVFTHA
jgi:hypothetical protein